MRIFIFSVLIMNASAIDSQENTDHFCKEALPKAWEQCYSLFQDGLDHADKQGVELPENLVNCCYLAELIYCLDLRTRQICTRRIRAFMGLASKSTYIDVKSLNQSCRDYSHEVSLHNPYFFNFLLTLREGLKINLYISLYRAYLVQWFTNLPS